MVRSQTFPYPHHAVATPGQLTWVWLNQSIDYEERVAKIHVHCLPKFHQQNCEVCHEPIFENKQFPKEIQDQIYRPGDGEAYNVTVNVEQPKAMGGGDEDTEDIPVYPDKHGNLRADLSVISDESEITDERDQ
jgi:hypothetical protein